MLCIRSWRRHNFSTCMVQYDTGMVLCVLSTVLVCYHDALWSCKILEQLSSYDFRFASKANKESFMQITPSILCYPINTCSHHATGMATIRQGRDQALLSCTAAPVSI